MPRKSRQVPWQQFLARHGACGGAREYARGKTFKDAWENCPHGAWLMWMYWHRPPSLPLFRLGVLDAVTATLMRLPEGRETFYRMVMHTIRTTPDSGLLIAIRGLLSSDFGRVHGTDQWQARERESHVRQMLLNAANVPDGSHNIARQVLQRLDLPLTAMGRSWDQAQAAVREIIRAHLPRPTFPSRYRTGPPKRRKARRAR